VTAKDRRSLYRNWVTYAGGFIFVMGLALVLTSVAFQYSIRKPGPYAGIISYVIFPNIAAGGGVLAVLGMVLEARRRKREGTTEARPFPRLDLNDPVQRRRFLIVGFIVPIVAVVFTFTGYNAFLLTESVAFCGTVCHTQMSPEYTAYQNSPHARVDCVACHVGDGAGPYVHSKLAGMMQLWGVISGSYDRPIPTPVKGLRPARETCEKCHWPKKFWGSTLYQRPHFRYDEENTPEQITLLIKTGGGEGNFDSGIHWHMVVQNEVQYVAEDAQLQEIPWVKIKRADGSTTEYWRSERKVEPSRLATMNHRTMDCMDCHNRPSHNFQTPDLAVDSALSRNLMSPTLPFLKTLGVNTLSKDFATSEAAHDTIRKDVLAFYADKYPEIAKARARDIDTAVDSLTAIFDRNVFPAMGVSWKTYPTNIGHRNSPGCFRCHDGRHVASDGRVLTHECKACHTEPKRGPLAGMGEVLSASEKDWHPWQLPQKYLEIKEHKNVLCHECHIAGRKPKTECNECHSH